MTDDMMLLDITEARGNWLHLESTPNPIAAEAAVDQWTAMMFAENWPAFEFAADGRHVFGRFVGTLAYLIRKAEEQKAQPSATEGTLGQPIPRRKAAGMVLSYLADGRQETSKQISKGLNIDQRTVLRILRRAALRRQVTRSGKLWESIHQEVCA